MTEAKFKIGDAVRVVQSGGSLGDSRYRIAAIDLDGLACHIRAIDPTTGVLEALQRFDTSLLAHDPAPAPDAWTTAPTPPADPVPAPAVPAPAKRTKKAKPPSRGDRWAEAVAACSAALSDLENAKDALEQAASDLHEVQQEYQEWLDNLDGKFSGSALVDKLETITGLEIEDMANSVTEAIDNARGVVDECEGADLPLGFGRD